MVTVTHSPIYYAKYNTYLCNNYIKWNVWIFVWANLFTIVLWTQYITLFGLLPPLKTIWMANVLVIYEFLYCTSKSNSLLVDHWNETMSQSYAVPVFILIQFSLPSIFFALLRKSKNFWSLIEFGECKLLSSISFWYRYLCVSRMKQIR